LFHGHQLVAFAKSFREADIAKTAAI